MNPFKEEAKKLLRHYFELCYEKATGEPLNDDGEIDHLVDSLVNAAVYEKDFERNDEM